MARIRTIKPEFWKDEDLSALPEIVHLFAAALLNYADDEGYFNANTGLIKAELFPLREPSMSIHGMLTELSNMGYIKLFRGKKGKTIGLVVNFTFHQKVNRPSPSKIKCLIEFTDDSVSPHEQLTAGTGNREQGTGKGDLTSTDVESSKDVTPETGKPNKDGRVNWIKKIQEEHPETDEQVIKDWLAVRRAKKAAMTETAWSGILRESKKANLPVGQVLKICAERGWQGFNAGWMTNDQQQTPTPKPRKLMPKPGDDR